MLIDSILITVKCEKCNGKGYISKFFGFKKKKCDLCSGKKEIILYMTPDKALEKGFI